MMDPANDGLSAMQANNDLSASQASPIVTDPVHLTVDLESNVYSQSGEDGIIAAVFVMLEVSTGTCVDIGANNGTFLSNTAYWRERGWLTLLVDMDTEFAETLKDFANTTVLIQEITPSNVVNMLNSWREIDLLSIDIDGDDLAVLTEMVRGGIRPKVVCIEYNPTYPPFFDRENPLGTNKGSSLSAVERVAIELGYDLVYATISNVILVETNTNAGRIRALNAFEAFRWDDVRYVVSDFDGQNYLANMHGVVDRVVNPWDHIDAAFAIQYPDEVLGYGENRAKRVIYNHWPRRPTQQE